MKLLDPNNSSGSDSNESLLENEGDSFDNAGIDEIEQPEMTEELADGDVEEQEQEPGDYAQPKSNYGVSDAVKQKAKDQAIKGLNKPIGKQIDKLGGKTGLSREASPGIATAAPEDHEHLKREAKERAKKYSQDVGARAEQRLVGGASKGMGQQAGKQAGKVAGDVAKDTGKVAMQKAGKLAKAGSHITKAGIDAGSMIDQLRGLPIFGNMLANALEKGEDELGRVLGFVLFVIWGILALLGLILCFTIVSAPLGVVLILMWNLLMVWPMAVYRITVWILLFVPFVDAAVEVIDLVVDDSKVRIGPFESILIILFDLMLIILFLTILAGVMWYVCDQAGYLGLGTGIIGDVVAKSVDWWTGSNYTTMVNDMCKNVNGFVGK